MEAVDPRLFYTGLVAEMYGQMRSVDPDPEPYARFVGRSGQPALELGCGDGDPLLALRARGLDVEGLDSSPDMLERCRHRAAMLDIDVVLHCQSIESMDLGRQYGSIYFAGPTFNLLADDVVAGLALERIAAHLATEGTALVPLFVPAPAPAGPVGTVREQTGDDGTRLRLTTVSEDRDEASRVQTTVLRYESEGAAGTRTTERPWTLHWHSQEGFAGLASDAGLAVAAVLDPQGKRAGPTDQQFTFLLKRANG